MPALRKFIAMPPPMVPAPMMPTVLTGMVGVSAGTSGTFQALREAKKEPVSKPLRGFDLD